MSFLKEAGIIRKPPFFTTLRNNGWTPRFHQEASPQGAADAINRPHEDYPRRIPDTLAAIEDTLDTLRENPRITLSLIRRVHRQVFPDHGHEAGEWRTVNVQAADHLAPGWQLLDKLMEELEQDYRDTDLSVQNLQNWHLDFETIHPLRDGNGRTGGIIVAAASFLREGTYLSPGQ